MFDKCNLKECKFCPFPCEMHTLNNSKGDVMATKHTVKKGESLWSIAQKYYGDGKQFIRIKEANNLKKDTIVTGQVLTIPTPYSNSEYYEIGKQLELALSDVESLPSVQKLLEMLDR